jgi:hypothetical protein
MICDVCGYGFVLRRWGPGRPRKRFGPANLRTLNGLASRSLKSVPPLVKRLPEMMVEPFVPLSLDIDEPTNGWAASLAARDIKVHLDDLGRLSI